MQPTDEDKSLPTPKRPEPAPPTKSPRTKVNELLEQLQGDMPRSEVERIKAALKIEIANLH